MPTVDILIPTIDRLESLIATLGGVASQTLADLRVVVADQSAESVGDHPVILMLRRMIEARGGRVEWYERPQVHGIAEQRDFLLRRSLSQWALYLDDDVVMEPWVVERLLETIQEQGCAFVGAFPSGLSHRDDVRPEQQVLELWEGPVRPEAVEPESPLWNRWNLHRAANLWHVGQRFSIERPKPYKVAWIASCILYDRRKLEAVGGFSFWPRLPRWHSGEEVLVQNLLMRRWGGCGIVPSGTYYTQLPTTVLNECESVDGHALELLDEMVARYAAG